MIIKNQSLLKLNSFRIDVCAKEYVEITNESELLELYSKHRKKRYYLSEVAVIFYLLKTLTD